LAPEARQRCHGAGAQVVAIGEATRQHDEIDIGDLGIGVPHHVRLLVGDALKRHRRVAVAIGSGEDDDG
jgi:hypothetical protein